MEKINTYLDRLNEISNLIYSLQDQEDSHEKREIAAVILGLMESGSSLERGARIDIKEIINS